MFLHTDTKKILVLLFTFMLSACSSQVMPHQGVTYQVYHDHLDKVSALAWDEAQKGVYVTLEKRNHRGKLLFIDAQHHLTPILSGLYKPDGLAYIGQTLYLSQEGNNQPLLEIKANAVTQAFYGIHYGEGLATSADHLWIIEDTKGPQGRLIKINPLTDKRDLILSGLTEAEGLCRTADGTLYFTEKAAGNVYQLVKGKPTIIASNLNHPSYLFCLDKDQLFITEDDRQNARLLYYHDGKVIPLLSGLKAAQTLIPVSNHQWLLAEQDRDRILLLTIPSLPKDPPLL